MVWDGGSILDTDKLEKVQLYAARILTSLPILAEPRRYHSWLERWPRKRKVGFRIPAATDLSRKAALLIARQYIVGVSVMGLRK